MVEFLGKDIGNVSLNYRIEDAKLDPPTVAMSAGRNGQYLVLTGDPITNKAVGEGTVVDAIEEHGADSLISNDTIKSLVKGNKDVGACACIGYMLIKITADEAVETKVAPTSSSSTTSWSKTTSNKTSTDYIVGTAYNVLRADKGKVYTLHNAGGKGSQTHVEQILGYRLWAFFDHLKSLRTTGNKPMFNLKDFSATGYVRFSGVKDNKQPLTEACPACVGVWTSLKGTHKFLSKIALDKD